MNLYAGQGLGFTGSKEIAFGLAPIFQLSLPESIGGGGNWRRVDSIKVYDNLYSYNQQDDQEIIEIISIIFGVLD